MGPLVGSVIRVAPLFFAGLRTSSFYCDKGMGSIIGTSFLSPLGGSVIEPLPKNSRNGITILRNCNFKYFLMEIV